MATHDQLTEAAQMQRSAAMRFGWWASLGTGLATAVTFAIAIATPPLSGELCGAGCYSYPYLDVASRFPRDYFWMFPALVANAFYVAFMLSLQARARPERQLFAQFAVALAIMAALTLLGDYVVQLSVIQPSILASEADGVAMLSQYNPHGIFIALEELGYGLMSASLAFMALACPAAFAWNAGSAGYSSAASRSASWPSHGSSHNMATGAGISSRSPSSRSRGSP